MAKMSCVYYYQNHHPFPVLCEDEDIRLVNGADQYEGRIEICFNETWGTICDGFWSTNDANVACRQLGFAATGKPCIVSPCKSQGQFYRGFLSVLISTTYPVSELFVAP